MDDDSIDMEDDLIMTVSIWEMTVSILEMTVSIWDILSLWAWLGTGRPREVLREAFRGACECVS
jgi:hypothetical protein